MRRIVTEIKTFGKGYRFRVQGGGFVIADRGVPGVQDVQLGDAVDFLLSPEKIKCASGQGPGYRCTSVKVVTQTVNQETSDDKLNIVVDFLQSPLGMDFIYRVQKKKWDLDINEEEEMATLLMASGNPNYYLIQAVKAGNVDLVKMAIRCGAKNTVGTAGLVKECLYRTLNARPDRKKQRVEIVELLVSYGWALDYLDALYVLSHKLGAVSDDLAEVCREALGTQKDILEKEIYRSNASLNQISSYLTRFLGSVMAKEVPDI